MSPRQWTSLIRLSIAKTLSAVEIMTQEPFACGDSGSDEVFAHFRSWPYVENSCRQGLGERQLRLHQVISVPLLRHDRTVERNLDEPQGSSFLAQSSHWCDTSCAPRW